MHNHSVFGPNSTLPPETPFQHESIFVNTSINFATVALVFYEYFITLPTEIKYFWRRRLTGASILFFANRYLVLAYCAALLRGAGPFTKHASLLCIQWSEGVRILEILCYIPWAAFSGLRVYALRGHSSGWPLGTLVFLLSIVPMCINFVDFKWAHLVSETLWGCSEAILEPAGLSIRFPSFVPLDEGLTQPSLTVTIVSRLSLVLADLTVLMTTWMSTYGVVRTLRPHTLSGVILWNGTVYFIILLLLNVMHLAFCARSVIPSAAHSHISDVVVVVEPLTSVLVSRFMLNLQSAIGRSYVHSDSVPTSINFERVVGSIKVVYSEADHHYHDDEEDGEEEDGDGEDSWSADDSEAVPPLSGERCWENFNMFCHGDVHVEAAGTASMTDMSFRTGSSGVY